MSLERHLTQTETTSLHDIPLLLLSSPCWANGTVVSPTFTHSYRPMSLGPLECTPVFPSSFLPSQTPPPRVPPWSLKSWDTNACRARSWSILQTREKQCHDLHSGRSRLRFQFLPLNNLWLWAGCSISPTLGFLICKMEKIKVFMWQGYYENLRSYYW